MRESSNSDVTIARRFRVGRFRQPLQDIEVSNIYVIHFIARLTVLHRRGQGVQWVHLHPLRAVKKFFRLNLRGKCASARPGHEVHPPARARVNFRTVFAGWLRFGGIFRWSLRATTKKRSSTFLAKKCTPRQKPAYAYAVLERAISKGYSVCLSVCIDLFSSTGTRVFNKLTYLLI